VTAAEKYLEHLQGLLLFMHIKRNYIPSLGQLDRLDPGTREELDLEFIGCLDEIVRDAKARVQNTFRYLEYLREAYAEERRNFLPDTGLDDAEEIKFIDELQQRPMPTVFQDRPTYRIMTGLAGDILSAAGQLGLAIHSKIVFRVSAY
jgi:hypothetical protein